MTLAVRVEPTDSYDVFVGVPSTPFENGFTQADVWTNKKRYQTAFLLNAALKTQATILLAGKRIACTHTLAEVCHGDVLVEFVNGL